MTLDLLLNYINEKMSNDLGEDNEELFLLYNKLSLIKKEMPMLDDLEKIRKTISFLEIKYDELSELSYYFNPIYIEIKKNIHKQNVKQIRINNRKRRSLEKNVRF